MAHYGMNHLLGAWRAQIAASKDEFNHQVVATRRRHGLNVGVQNRLAKNGANKSVLLGKNYEPKFIMPRGKAWLRTAILSGL